MSTLLMLLDRTDEAFNTKGFKAEASVILNFEKDSWVEGDYLLALFGDIDKTYSGILNGPPSPQQWFDQVNRRLSLLKELADK